MLPIPNLSAAHDSSQFSFSVSCSSSLSPPPLLFFSPPRDRVSLIWGDVSLHLSRLVLISEQSSYLRERALVGLLKVVNRLTNRDDVRSEVRAVWKLEQCRLGFERFEFIRVSLLDPRGITVLLNEWCGLVHIVVMSALWEGCL